MHGASGQRPKTSFLIKVFQLLSGQAEAVFRTVRCDRRDPFRKKKCSSPRNKHMSSVVAHHFYHSYFVFVRELIYGRSVR